jgi:hypothetical protein
MSFQLPGTPISVEIPKYTTAACPSPYMLSTHYQYPAPLNGIQREWRFDEHYNRDHVNAGTLSKKITELISAP